MWRTKSFLCENVWSPAVRTARLIELTMAWEEGMEVANKRKEAKYANLLVGCRESGGSVWLYLV